MLSQNEVRHVAELAKLELSEEEVERFGDQLSSILDYFEAIQEIDTSSVSPTPHILPLQNVMAEDRTEPSLSQEKALANAADHDDGYFRVRAIFEE